MNRVTVLLFVLVLACSGTETLKGWEFNSKIQGFIYLTDYKGYIFGTSKNDGTLIQRCDRRGACVKIAHCRSEVLSAAVLKDHLYVTHVSEVWRVPLLYNNNIPVDYEWEKIDTEWVRDSLKDFKVSFNFPTITFYKTNSKWLYTSFWSMQMPNLDFEKPEPGPGSLKKYFRVPTRDIVDFFVQDSEALNESFNGVAVQKVSSQSYRFVALKHSHDYIYIYFDKTIEDVKDNFSYWINPNGLGVWVINDKDLYFFDLHDKKSSTAYNVDLPDNLEFCKIGGDILICREVENCSETDCQFKMLHIYELFGDYQNYGLVKIQTGNVIEGYTELLEIFGGDDGCILKTELFNNLEVTRLSNDDANSFLIGEPGETQLWIETYTLPQKFQSFKLIGPWSECQDGVQIRTVNCADSVDFSVVLPITECDWTVKTLPETKQQCVSTISSDFINFETKGKFLMSHGDIVFDSIYMRSAGSYIRRCNFNDGSCIIIGLVTINVDAMWINGDDVLIYEELSKSGINHWEVYKASLESVLTTNEIIEFRRVQLSSVFSQLNDEYPGQHSIRIIDDSPLTLVIYKIEYDDDSEYTYLKDVFVLLSDVRNLETLTTDDIVAQGDKCTYRVYHKTPEIVFAFWNNSSYDYNLVLGAKDPAGSFYNCPTQLALGGKSTGVFKSARMNRYYADFNPVVDDHGEIFLTYGLNIIKLQYGQQGGFRIGEKSVKDIEIPNFGFEDTEMLNFLIASGQYLVIRFKDANKEESNIGMALYKFDSQLKFELLSHFVLGPKDPYADLSIGDVFGTPFGLKDQILNFDGHATRVLYEFNWFAEKWDECEKPSDNVSRRVECRNNNNDIVSDSFCLEYFSKPSHAKSCKNSPVSQELNGFEIIPMTKILFDCNGYWFGTLVNESDQKLFRCPSIANNQYVFTESCTLIQSIPGMIRDGLITRDYIHLIASNPIKNGHHILSAEYSVFLASKSDVCSADIPVSTAKDLFKKIEPSEYLKGSAHMTTDTILKVSTSPLGFIVYEDTDPSYAFYSLSQRNWDSVIEEDYVLDTSQSYIALPYPDLKHVFQVKYTYDDDGNAKAVVGKYKIGDNHYPSDLISSFEYSGTTSKETDHLREYDMKKLLSYNLEKGYVYTIDSFIHFEESRFNVEVCQYKLEYGNNNEKCMKLRNLIDAAGGNGKESLCIGQFSDGIVWCREMGHQRTYDYADTSLTRIYKINDEEFSFKLLDSGNMIRNDVRDVTFKDSFEELANASYFPDKSSLSLANGLNSKILTVNERSYDSEINKMVVKTPYFDDFSRWYISDWSECVEVPSNDYEGKSTRTVKCISSEGNDITDEKCEAYKSKPSTEKNCLITKNINEWTPITLSNLGDLGAMLYENNNNRFFGIDDKIVRCHNNSNNESQYDFTCEIKVVFGAGRPVEMVVLQSVVLVIVRYDNNADDDLKYHDNIYKFPDFVNETMEVIELDSSHYVLIDSDVEKFLIEALVSNNWRLSFQKYNEDDVTGLNFMNQNNDSRNSVLVKTSPISLSESSKITSDNILAAGDREYLYIKNLSVGLSVDMSNGKLVVGNVVSDKSSNEDEDTLSVKDSMLKTHLSSLQVNDDDVGSIDDFEFVYSDTGNLYLTTLNSSEFSKRRVCRFKIDINDETITSSNGKCIDESDILKDQYATCGISKNVLFCDIVESTCGKNSESAFCHPTAMELFDIEHLPSIYTMGLGNTIDSEEYNLFSIDSNKVVSKKEFITGQIPKLEVGKMSIREDGKRITNVRIPTKICGIRNIFIEIVYSSGGYSWQLGEWSSCSKECDSGIQTRTVKCVHTSSGSILSDSKCTELVSKPVTQQKCNTSKCFEWRVGEWSSCSKMCGDGAKTRPVKCYDHNNTVVEDTKCKRDGDMPDRKKTCKIDECNWVCKDSDGSYSPEACAKCSYGSVKPYCASVCEAGSCIVKTSEQSLYDCDFATKPEELCGDPCKKYNVNCENGGICMYSYGSRPVCECPLGFSGTTCQRDDTTPTYFYAVTSWSECSESCGEEGKKSRIYTCKKIQNGVITDEPSSSTNCDSLLKPVTIKPCNLYSCEVEDKKVEVSLSLKGKMFRNFLLSAALRNILLRQFLEEIAEVLGIDSNNIEVITFEIAKLVTLRRNLSEDSIDSIDVKFAVVPDDNDDHIDQNIDNMIKDLKNPESVTRQKSVLLSKADVKTLQIEGYNLDNDDSTGGSSFPLAVIIIGVIFIAGIVVAGLYFVKTKNNANATTNETCKNDVEAQFATTMNPAYKGFNETQNK